LAGKGPKSRNPVGRRATPAGDPQSATPRDAGRHDASTGLRWKPKLLIAASVVAAMVLIGLALRFLTSGLMTALSNANRSDSAEAATFVGSETCAGCHRAEAELWRGSQHKRAMDHATDKSALGDFNDATFAYYGLTSRFFRHDGKFLVETDAPDGKLATFEIKYTFGVDPLQQYLVEFPDGRLQALPLAWDSRPKDKGGQRWFHIHPNEEIRHDDYLHWTRLNQNWNYMCAECHSTGVRKNYDAAKDRYATTWSEISVGCETCHGQGSDHVAWAREQQSWRPFGRRADPTEGLRVRFDERQDITWPIDPRTGNATRRIAPATLRKEVETCGLCHARRGQISEDWVPGRWLSDTHVDSPITRDVYHAGGQIRDVEEPNYVPFKQSRMFAAGVTCSDCQSRTAPRCTRPQTASACNVTHRRSMRATAAARPAARRAWRARSPACRERRFVPSGPDRRAPSAPRRCSRARRARRAR